jgi:hypothetical protein
LVHRYYRAELCAKAKLPIAESWIRISMDTVALIDCGSDILAERRARELKPVNRKRGVSRTRTV